jgi:hypothetical protein
MGERDEEISRAEIVLGIALGGSLLGLIISLL